MEIESIFNVIDVYGLLSQGKIFGDPSLRI
jgi:hypothetical protein